MIEMYGTADDAQQSRSCRIHSVQNRVMKLGRIYRDFTELVGNTPLVELTKIRKKYDLQSRILAKIEYLNPAGSVKDRTAWGIIREAEKNGRLKPGDLVFDLTSGNTGIGIAAVASARGYRSSRTRRRERNENTITSSHRQYCNKAACQPERDQITGASSLRNVRQRTNCDAELPQNSTISSFFSQFIRSK